MNYLCIALVIVAGLFGCAETQEVAKYVPLAERVACRAAALAPYNKYFTQDSLQEVLHQTECPYEVLELYEVAKEDIYKLQTAWDQCK